MKRKYLIINFENLMKMFRMHDGDKPNRRVPLINRKRTGYSIIKLGKY